MNDQGIQTESEFVLRRVSGSFSQFLDQVAGAIPVGVVLASIALLVVARVLRRSARAKNPKAGGWYPLLFWAVIVANVAYFCRRLFLRELTATDEGAGLSTEFTFQNTALWYTLVGVILMLGLVFVIWKYIRERKAAGWWAIPLALCRCAVYVLLAGAFL